jgi:hypothetical protein
MSHHTVSGVVVQEKEEESKVIQQTIYYISEALLGAKLNYIEHSDFIQKVETLLLSA